MNAPLPFSPQDKSTRLKRLLQEPLTFLGLIWALMLLLVGLCFAFVE